MIENIKNFLTNLPNSSGVYFFKDAKNTIIYIGKAKNLKKRVSSYFVGKKDFKVVMMVPNIRYIDFLVTDTDEEAFLWENTLIKRFSPKYNIDLKDDKTYPYLKLTTDKFPSIYITRKVENDGAEYFGPYVDVETLKWVVSLIKQIFNLRKCKKKLTGKKEKRPCLNFFMNKCLGPCCYAIKTQDSSELLKDIKKFVKCDYKNLLKKWKKEIQELSTNLNFEKAEILKQKILNLEKLQNWNIKVWEIKKDDLEKLHQIYDKKEQELANLENIFDLPKKVKTIACFDISNISGKHAVGSRVVFVDGKPEKSMYRKYKIKYTSTEKPNDFAMMNEVIERTLKGDDIEKIDLFVIDGGKGQLNVAENLLKFYKKNISLISIAKKQEIIFLPHQKNGIRLPMNSEILKLIRHLRDEAHRFAITYHKKLRSKNSLKT